VALLGLGTGITASAALLHPSVAELTLVELVPEVVVAARAHFHEANLAVLSQPRARLVVADARSWLRQTGERYDVIVGDLVVPWRQGESGLYTREHFAAARRALAPGGLFCQWVPLFQLSAADLELVLRTYLSVFERASVWRGDFSAAEPAVAFVGGAGSILPATDGLGRRLAELRPDPANPHLADPFTLWMHFAGIAEADGRSAAGEEGALHTLGTPWLELHGPPGGDGPPACTGRCLAAWLDELRHSSGDALAGLGPLEREAIAAGELLSRFALALAANDDARARALHDELRERLPPRTFEALFPAR
jgi:hypothetical protein